MSRWQSLEELRWTLYYLPQALPTAVSEESKEGRVEGYRARRTAQPPPFVFTRDLLLNNPFKENCGTRGTKSSKTHTETKSAAAHIHVQWLDRHWERHGKILIAMLDNYHPPPPYICRWWLNLNFFKIKFYSLTLFFSDNLHYTDLHKL